MDVITSRSPLCSWKTTELPFLDIGALPERSIPSAGRVLNRFSSDTATADDALPFTLNILLANLFGLVGTILVLCLSEPYLLLALIPLAILYKHLQTYYRHTARELRRLNSIAR